MSTVFHSAITTGVKNEYGPDGILPGEKAAHKTLLESFCFWLRKVVRILMVACRFLMVGVLGSFLRYTRIGIRKPVNQGIGCIDVSTQSIPLVMSYDS